jgi:hypothetical protein
MKARLHKNRIAEKRYLRGMIAIVFAMLTVMPLYVTADDGVPPEDGAPVFADPDRADADPPAATTGSGIASEAEPVFSEPSYVQTQNEEAINVVVPASLDFVIDPFELAKRGQVYSDAYVVENQGSSDVLLTGDVEVLFANETDFEAISHPFDESSNSVLKEICLLLDFGRSDVPPVAITDKARAAIPAVLLRASGNDLSACSLKITGSVNPYPAAEWRDGDVKIRLNYHIETLARSQDETAAPAADPSAESAVDSIGQSAENAVESTDPNAESAVENTDPNAENAAESTDPNAESAVESTDPNAENTNANAESEASRDMEQGEK